MKRRRVKEREGWEKKAGDKRRRRQGNKGIKEEGEIEGRRAKR